MPPQPLPFVAIGPIIAETNIRFGDVSPVAWATLLGTGSTQVIAQRLRGSLYFFNPGTENVYLCPAQDENGNALAAMVAGAGTILIPPGIGVPLTGACTSAFNACAQSGSNNPFTVWEFL